MIAGTLALSLGRERVAVRAERLSREARAE
jgi:hypothetical protein